MSPSQLVPEITPDGRLGLRAGTDGPFTLNDWSFGQLCGLAKVGKETVNRLTPDTAARAFQETLPRGNKPLRLLARGEGIRSVHGTAYTRLHNADLVGTLKEHATDFTPSQAGLNGATGLYCGEQDPFAFLIDPAGWAGIDGEAFAPGVFVWNSEVGKRSVGIQTFGFQKVCANHIVWDAVEVIEFARKHTARAVSALADIRRRVDALVAKRGERRDGFAAVLCRGDSRFQHKDITMTTCSGHRKEDGCAVTVEDGTGSRGLDPRFDLRKHSLTGFEWGYGGSGPAQLALALAADVLGDDEAALDVYQRLKFRVVGRLPADGWTRTEAELAEAIRGLRGADGE